MFIKNKYHLLTKLILNFNFIEILLKIMIIFFLTNMKKHLNEKYLDVIYENMINFFSPFKITCYIQDLHICEHSFTISSNLNEF